MGVTTTADKALDAADEHLREAIRELSKLIVDRCWGHDEFGESYKQHIQEAFVSLLGIRANLNRD